MAGESKTPFAAGDRLRVWRGLYYHHGIGVGEDRLVQFGGSIFDKPHARIEEVPLSCFLRGGRAEVVDQSKLTWVGRWKLPPRCRVNASSPALAVSHACPRSAPAT
jgi:hypothetical protein